jgi:hypothetical protein
MEFSALGGFKLKLSDKPIIFPPKAGVELSAFGGFIIDIRFRYIELDLELFSPKSKTLKWLPFCY